MIQVNPSPYAAIVFLAPPKSPLCSPVWIFLMPTSFFSFFATLANVCFRSYKIQEKWQFFSSYEIILGIWKKYISENQKQVWAKPSTANKNLNFGLGKLSQIIIIIIIISTFLKQKQKTKSIATEFHCPDKRLSYYQAFRSLLNLLVYHLYLLHFTMTKTVFLCLFSRNWINKIWASGKIIWVVPILLR